MLGLFLFYLVRLGAGDKRVARRAQVQAVVAAWYRRVATQSFVSSSAGAYHIADDAVPRPNFGPAW